MTFSQFVQDNLFLFILLVILIVTTVIYELRNKNAGGKTITSIAAARLINDGAYLIDTRTTTEYKKGHISGAKSHPVDRFADDIEHMKAQKEQSVIIYCQNGLSAKTQAALLRQHGFSDVYVLSGGIQGWRDENLPTVKG
ncbi:MAG: sulfurtransferase [Cardiobacteriales bacterium]|nr:MAG: sulfurtransferase [Cardiobacteriales bacterium]